jgi:hypothetical protein
MSTPAFRRVAIVRCPWCTSTTAEWWVADGELCEVRSASERRALANQPRPFGGSLLRLILRPETFGPPWCADQDNHPWVYGNHFKRRLHAAIADGQEIAIRTRRRVD